MKEQTHEKLIEKFFTDALTQEELNQFESLLAKDPNFAKLFDEYYESWDIIYSPHKEKLGLDELQFNELKTSSTTLEDFMHDISQRPPNSQNGRGKIVLISVAAIFITLISLKAVFWLQEHKLEETEQVFGRNVPSEPKVSEEKKDKLKSDKQLNREDSSAKSEITSVKKDTATKPYSELSNIPRPSERQEVALAERYKLNASLEQRMRSTLRSESTVFSLLLPEPHLTLKTEALRFAWQSQNLDNSFFTIELVSSENKVVLTKQMRVSNKQSDISLKDLPAGVYYWKLMIEDVLVEIGRIYYKIPQELEPVSVP